MGVNVYAELGMPTVRSFCHRASSTATRQLICVAIVHVRRWLSHSEKSRPRQYGGLRISAVSTIISTIRFAHCSGIISTN